MKYSVQVKPGSSKGPLVIVDATTLTVYVRQRAVDGAANQAVIEVLAKHFGVSKTQVHIVRGQTSRSKIVNVDD